jgi:hypothetical protein
LGFRGIYVYHAPRCWRIFPERRRERERGFLSRERVRTVRTLRIRDLVNVRSFTLFFSSVIRRFVLVSLALSFFSLRVLILSFSSFSLSLVLRSGGGSSNKGRGPGSAPLRMETQEQRKLGYGGDDGGMGGGGGDDGDDGDDGDYDDGWNPGGEGEPSTMGLGILLVIGAWALWEYKRPGGSLNPQTKIDQQRARYEKAFKNKYGYYPGEEPARRVGGGSSSITFGGSAAAIGGGGGKEEEYEDDDDDEEDDDDDDDDDE